MHAPFTAPNTPTLCRACLSTWADGIARSGRAEDPCPACHKPTLRSHPELFDLAIAHVDCDAFYASVEKRDNPSLRDKPVLIGGSSPRAVVTTACYVARHFGPRSAMPMFKALRLCPDAVVIKPDMAKYRAVSVEIRALMAELTPMVEPVSLDEAYLDLTLGVRTCPGKPAALLLAEFAQAVRRKIGISVSIGLAPNKALAKLASDLDKPRGFAVIGRHEARGLLRGMAVSKIHGIGPQTARRLEQRGITTIGQLQDLDVGELHELFGRSAERLARLVVGEDHRPVAPERVTKSVSAETTFQIDRSDQRDLIEALRGLSERVAERLLQKNLAGHTVVIKLKTSDFQLLSRHARLSQPTRDAEVMIRAAARLVEREADGRTFRLVGIGVTDLRHTDEAAQPDLFGGPASLYVKASR
ncbi:MAG: DNA polymerase IV [Hyphomicrobiaceae bacterium]